MVECRFSRVLGAAVGLVGAECAARDAEGIGVVEDGQSFGVDEAIGAEDGEALVFVERRTAGSARKGLERSIEAEEVLVDLDADLRWKSVGEEGVCGLLRWLSTQKGSCPGTSAVKPRLEMVDRGTAAEC